jgi:hypothetical protein
MPVADYELQGFFGSPVKTWQQIPYFQSYTVNIGRQFQLDTYRADTATVEIWYQQYLQLETYLKVDVPMRIYDDTRSVVLFQGNIKDVEIMYGMPYNSVSGIGNADRMVITLESTFAAFGRMSGNGYVMAAAKLGTQLDNAETQTNVSIVNPSDASTIDMGGQTLQGTWGDWLNRVLLTLNNRLRQQPSLEVVSKYSIPTLTYSFATADGPLFQRYDQVTFDSLSDNYYTQVTVDPEGLAEQTVQSGSAPYRTYKVDTLNASTGQALDYANYLLNNYDNPQLALSTITATSQQQGTNFYLDTLGYVGSGSPPTTYTQSLVGRATVLTLRGVGYNFVIEGLTVSGDPETQRFTYYVSAQDLNAYLILDDSVYGTLDNNKLGY